MKLKKYINLHRKRLEDALLRYLEAKMEEFSDNHLHLESTKKIAETVVGGKLIRGILVLLAYESRKHEITDDAVRLAAAIELIHTGLIIHDDIMDNDRLRRGRQTVFAQAIQDGKSNHAQNPKDYGNAIAICIGDLTFFMAQEMLSGITDNSKGLGIMRVISRELQHVGYAQISDIHFGIDRIEPSAQDILTLYKFKTARYSFSLPLKTGGMLAGYSVKQLGKFDSFGEAIGIAFQVKDDELGIFGDEKVLGKSVGSDIRENKKTLIRHALLSAADRKDYKQMLSIFGKKSLTKNDINVIRNYLLKYKVVEIMQKTRAESANEAKKIIVKMDLPEVYKSVFLDLVEFTNNREK